MNLVRYLDSSKYEQKIVCTQAIGDLPNIFRESHCDVIEVGIFSGLLDIQKYKKVMAVIDAFQPDIIHGAVFEGVTLALISGYLKKVPIIIGEETSDPQNRSWRGNLLLKLLANLSDCMVGVSSSAYTYLTNVIKLRKDKVFLIENGVDA